MKKEQKISKHTFIILSSFIAVYAAQGFFGIDVFTSFLLLFLVFGFIAAMRSETVAQNVQTELKIRERPSLLNIPRKCYVTCQTQFQ